MGYDRRFTDALQFVWGEGFRSPGGEDEVEQLLRGHDIRGLAALDIGSGLGGVDLLLAERHGTGHVTGIDVVFSKDAMIHIPDKPALYADRASGARLRIAAIRAGGSKPSHLGGRKRQVSPVAGSPELRR